MSARPELRHQILLVGNLSSVADSLTEEVKSAGFHPVLAPTPEKAMSGLNGESVFAIVYEAGSAAVDTVCTMVRANPRFDRVPLIAFVPDPTDEALVPIFASGADDFLPLGERGDLEDKLAALRQMALGRPSYTEARAIVADSDRLRRIQYARVLRQASYDITFALEGGEIDVVISRDPTVQVVVADSELPPDGALSALEATRTERKERPLWIVCGSAEQRALAEPKLESLGLAGFHDRAAPPENLGFIVNRLAAIPSSSKRSSARVLYCAPVTYRLEGRTNNVWGSTFNLSRGGLYIRTLNPLPFGSMVRIRMNAPEGRTRVELRARVVWRKEYGAETARPGPAGMGMELTGCDASALQSFEAGYDKLL